MTLEQLKERIEAQCMRHGLECTGISTMPIFGKEIYCAVHIKKGNTFSLYQPNTDLLLEGVDLECRAIKARQGIATNGIDE